MKFWQKSFLCMVIVFLLGVDVMGYVLAGRSYVLNKDVTIAASEMEQQMIGRALYQSIALSSKNFEVWNPENLAVTVSPYVNYYRNQGIYFELYQSGVLAYGNLPGGDTEPLLRGGGERFAEIREIAGRLYCVISSRLEEPYADLQYVYIKDVQQLADFKTNIIEIFTRIAVASGLMLSVVVFVLLIGLTAPFRKLNMAAAEISAGHYGKRVKIKSRDEIGDYAKSFNLMADSVETHIAELSRLTESKQNFIDNLAHEIRTPVTAIVGYGELLKYANCGRADRETAVDHIISQGRRVQNLSHKLLDLAYLGNERILLSPVSLETVLQDVEAALKHRLHEKDIVLRTQIQSAAINGDAEWLASLFINLLDNAVNASAPGNAIELYVTRRPESVFVEIIDHGKGMERSEIPKIVEPFYRIDKSRSKSGGTGLGLALCARICEIHGASFDISSELGKGTKIKIGFTTL
ncbi:MAG: HAMP domain-containing histidine kinase [Clostridium sp.]|jgi:signal transduction histidine kinase|nr:HAMP domain-containing histidine kinase [Clostridium sp.]